MSIGQEVWQAYYLNLLQRNRALKLWGLAFALLMTCVFMLVDWSFWQDQPLVLEKVLWYRLSTCFLPLIVLTSILASGYGISWYNRLTQLTIILASTGIVAVHLQAPQGFVFESVIPALILVALFGFFCSSMSWREKIISIWPLVIINFGLDIYRELPIPIIFHHGAYMVTICLIGTVVSYSYEKTLLEKARIREELHKLNETDLLTGLDNFASFETRFQEMAARGFNKGVAVGILSIDHFNLYIDHYGRKEADIRIRQIADYLRQEFAGFAHICRLSRDEFSLTFHDFSREQADQLASHLVRSIYDLEIAHWVDAKSGRVTASLGMTWSDVVLGRDLHQMLNQSDKLLTQAKLQGNTAFCKELEEISEDPYYLRSKVNL